MKKTIVLLLALVMLLVLASTAMAATSGQLQDGDNEIELPWNAAEASTYTYTATRTGTLYVAATAFGSCYKGDDYSDNSEYMEEWEMYTELTVNGEFLENHYYGTIQVEKGQTYTFVWEHSFKGSYSWNATLNLSYTNENMPKQGTEDLPVKLHRDDCPKGSIQIGPGEIAYYTLFEFDGTCLQIEGEHAYAVVTSFNEDMEQITVTYRAEDGVATVPIPSDYITIQIGNDGDEPAIFGLNWFYPVGSYRNPQELAEGENTAVTVKDNYDGYYFSWTAMCYGKLTLTFPETGWMYSIQNTTTGEKIDTCYYSDNGVQNPVILEVSKGDVIEVIVNSYSKSTLSVPGGDVVFTAASEFGHFYGDPVVSEQPENCQGVGTRTQKCKLCKYEYVETFTGQHSAEAFPEGKAATCEENGLLPHWYCAACDSYFSDEALTQETTREELSIPALGHSYAVSGTTDGTCVIKSTTVYTCETCGGSYTEEGAVDDSNHQNTGLVNETAATCLLDGYTGDLACADCGALLTEGQSIAATGHSFGQWSTTEDGRYRSRTCENCGHEETEDLGCQHTQTQLTGTVEASCTAAGYTGDICCIYCGKVMESGAGIPALGHSYACTATTVGTCVTKSTSTYTCSVCSYSYTETGSLDEDNHGETELKNAATATCTAEGYTGDQVCVDCGKVITAGQKIDMLEHSFGDWITSDDGSSMVRTCSDCGYQEVENLQCEHAVTDTIDVTEATCTADGYTGDVVCMACGQILTEGTVIPATGHSFGDWVVTLEPTATVDGSQMRQCAACGEQETEVIPATGEPATEPTEPPTQPTEPTEPPTQPSEPATEPSEPATAPTQPSEPGTEPTEPPTTQATQPTAPESQPTQPATQQSGDQNDDDGNAGIVIAVVVAVLVAGGLAVVLIKKKKQ